MAIIVDNIELDETNVEFNYAADFVNNTDRLIFLTGKAGTGKTTFLKYIKQISNKNTIILAYTGAAAINAGGVTINSFFQIPFGPFIPNDKRLRTSKNSEDNRVPVEKTTWKYIEYIWNKELKRVEEKIKGTFTQYPLRLAWAITVHKSQGLTFEKVIADLGAAFEGGQVYVALSRCTPFSGLSLKRIIPRNAIRVNKKAIEFAQNETPGTLIIQELNSGRADFYYKKARDAAKAHDFSTVYDNIIKAIRYRNDIETDIFKRYFVAHANRLNNCIKNKMLNEFEIVKKGHSFVQKINIESSSDNKKEGIKIHEQNKSREYLLDKARKDRLRNKI